MKTDRESLGVSTILLDLLILCFSILFVLVLYFNMDFRSTLYEISDYILRNVSRIPLTVSFGSALILTLMYIGSVFTTPVIKVLVIPMWILAAVSYFLPNLIPERYSLVTLIVFSGVYLAIVLFFKMREKSVISTKRRMVAREIVQKINSVNFDSPYRDLIIEDSIVKVLEKYKIP